MEKNIKKVHAQSKYFTIMLIPNSSNKTRSIKISNRFLYTVGLLCLTLISFSVISYGFTTYQSKKITKVSKQLEETVNNNADLLVEKEKIEGELEEKKEFIQDELDAQKKLYEQEILDLTNKTKETEEKLEELEKAREELGRKINTKQELISEEHYETEKVNEAQVVSMMYMKEQKNIEHANLKTTIDTLFDKVNKESENYNLLKEQINNDYGILASIPSIWPLKGIVTSEAGSRVKPLSGIGYEYHGGLDIAVPVGTAVKAGGAGKVIFSGVQGGYGNLVIIDHNNGLNSYYGHLSKTLVKKGDIVKKRDIIARSGNTGKSTGPHLHYEIRLNDVVQNPRNYIEE